MKSLILENDRILVEITLDGGARMTRLLDKALGHDWLVREEPLFSYSVTTDIAPRGFDLAENGDSRQMTLRKAEQNSDGLIITLYSEIVEAEMSISISREYSNVFYVQLTMRNLLDKTVMYQVILPDISILSTIGNEADMRAMIPYELGGVGVYGKGSRYGAAPGIEGMPTAFNSLEVAAVFNASSGQGIFFADLNGVPGGDATPIQLYIDQYRMTGHWTDIAEASGSTRTPVLAVGLISSGGWQNAVDYYLNKHTPQINPSADIPLWLLESGAIYSTRREGTGGAYQCLPGTTDLNTQISDFRQMPVLLEKAQQYGTNNIILVDYYEKAITNGGLDDATAAIVDSMPYWNKGDYIPRSDLGGEEAFIEGIRLVHQEGGRIIVYVEPYIIFFFSEIGRTKGIRWAAHTKDGMVDGSYSLCYTMQPANKAWQDEVVKICERLVEQYDVDGILLDSLGWQWNHLFYTLSEKVMYTMDEYNVGLLTLSTRVRKAIRAIKPDAVVLSESGAGLMIGRNDGGFTADYCWSNATGNDYVLESPTKYAYPSASLYSAGRTLNSIHQVFATGYSFALCDYWQEYKDEIKALVTLRQEYKDALIYGKQSVLPETGNAKLAAYIYSGKENEILVLMNAGSRVFDYCISLPNYGNSEWECLHGTRLDTLYVGQDSSVNISIEPQSILVYRRK